MQLTLRSLTVLSPDEVAIMLVDDAGDEVTYRFTVEQVDRIWVDSGEPDSINARYRCVPGPALPMWPERLTIAALRAVREPLPDAETAAVLNAQVREGLNRKWPTASELTTQDTRWWVWLRDEVHPAPCNIRATSAWHELPRKDQTGTDWPRGRKVTKRRRRR